MSDISGAPTFCVNWYRHYDQAAVSNEASQTRLAQRCSHLMCAMSDMSSAPTFCAIWYRRL